MRGCFLLRRNVFLGNMLRYGYMPVIGVLLTSLLNFAVVRGNEVISAVIDRMLRAYQGEYCIESFNPLVLLWYRRYHNSVVRGQLASNFRIDGGHKSPLYFFMTHLLLNIFTAPDFIAYNHQFEEEPGRRICKWLYRHPAVAWTIRSEAELKKMDGKFDVFIFENFLP